MSFVLRPTILHVCFDDVQDGVREARGTISGIALEGASSFKSIQEFLFLIDKLLDRIGKPQASRAKREDFNGKITYSSYVSDPTIYHKSEEILARRGSGKTYNILFNSRYYSSWQGILFDADGNEVGRFSSDLQLLKLLVPRGADRPGFGSREKDTAGQSEPVPVSRQNVVYEGEHSDNSRDVSEGLEKTYRGIANYGKDMLQEGKIISAVETSREIGNLSDDGIRKYIMKKFGLSEQEAEHYVK